MFASGEEDMRNAPARRLYADMAIIGFGGAGAVAAIEAARRGADVIIVERAQQGQEGGNTRVSSQGFINPRDPGAALRYLTALSRDAPIKPARLAAWAEEACLNVSWLESNGIASEELASSGSHPEYPEFPGAETVVKHRVKAASGPSLWDSLRARVEDLGIHIEYGWRAVSLRRNHAGRVSDVICTDGRGGRLDVVGRRGVVLACGGFGGSPRYLAKFVPGVAATAGCPHNVGDGLSMAAAVGARWLGLDAAAGPYLAFLPPGYRTTVPLEPLRSHDEGRGTCLVVDPEGRRVTAADLVSRHGRVPDGKGGWTTAMLPIRSEFLCDGDLLASTPLVKDIRTAGAGWCRAVEGLRWSADNQQERERGWIKEVTGDALLAAAGPRHGAPLFSLPLVTSILNTQGGPERDEYCRLIGGDGMPISGLFGAGELGSVFPGLYQGSGNLADCLVSGRVAARAALAIG